MERHLLSTDSVNGIVGQMDRILKMKQGQLDNQLDDALNLSSLSIFWAVRMGKAAREASTALKIRHDDNFVPQFALLFLLIGITE